MIWYSRFATCCRWEGEAFEDLIGKHVEAKGPQSGADWAGGTREKMGSLFPYFRCFSRLFLASCEGGRADRELAPPRGNLEHSDAMYAKLSGESLISL